jgi:phosphatidate cytidylyltransferase
VADQKTTPVADTSEPTKKTSRAGRNLPAAIAVGVLLGAMAIVILLFAPSGWLVVLTVAMPIATHEVVRRLREAGYALPVIPLLIGGLAMIWLTWPYGAAGL